MIEIQEMTDLQIAELLQRTGYGHLACSVDDRPYLVPVHFAYDSGEIVIYTTEGKKSQIIAKNPAVCLQAEEVTDDQNWQSVIVNGTARSITSTKEREAALELISAINPTLTPAVSIRWLDNWVRENIEVVYRIKPEHTSGRRASSDHCSSAGASARQTKDTIF